MFQANTPFEDASEEELKMFKESKSKNSELTSKKKRKIESEMI